MSQSMHLVSEDYYSARDKFLSAARVVGASCRSASISQKGPKGKNIFIDLAVLGSPRARKVLVHLSGVHGVEGFIGSAIQSAVLRERLLVPDDTALVFVHAVNPFGFAWLRRTNENNVDLNRNGISENEFPIRIKKSYKEYLEISDQLGIEQSDFDPQAYEDSFSRLIKELGEPVLKQALAGGQYAHPAGLFYGGTELQESYRILRELLKEPLASAKLACAIDVHKHPAINSLTNSILWSSEICYKWASRVRTFLSSHNTEVQNGQEAKQICKSRDFRRSRDFGVFTRSW